MPDQRIKIIDGFLDLHEGWDSYGAPPIRPESVGLAKVVLTALPERAHPMPNNDEGVDFEWDDDGQTYSVTCWAMPLEELRRKENSTHG